MSRKREAHRQATHAADVGSTIRTNRGDRDFLRELEEQRAAASGGSVSSGSYGSAGTSAVPIVSGREPTAVPVMASPAPIDQPMAASAPVPEQQSIPAGAPSMDRTEAARRSTPEVEDLDIPAFLRRNR
jgi:hypothetical protein